MATRYVDATKSYAFDVVQMRTLEQVKERLYADKPLSGDDRRDLANVLDAIMHQAIEFSVHNGYERED